MRIRPEEPGDIEAIERVTIDAFEHAPHTDHTEQFIVRGLRAAGALTVSLVAELDAATVGQIVGQIVGHVAVSRVTISDGTSDWFGLGPISVSPRHQGQGIGSELMRAAIAALREVAAGGCVLLGDPNYYRRFGFEPVSGLVLSGVPAQYFQALLLAGPMPRGEVTYHQAFSATA